MRFPNSSCLLCRHSVLSRAWNTQRVVTINSSQPASSLSAIHHGLRESEKSRPQGFKPKSLEAAKPRRAPQNSRFARDPDWTPPSFKIKRGKKDITDTGPERQSRRSRFNDPENSFGKRSLVFQMKHGALRQKMADLETGERAPNTSSSRRTTPGRLSSDDFMKDFDSSAGRSTRDGNKGRSSSNTRRPAGRESRTRSFADTKSFDRERKPHTGSFSGTRSFDKERKPLASSFTDRKSFDDERKPRTSSFADKRSFDDERKPRANPFGDTKSFDRERKPRSRSFADRGSFDSERKPRTSSFTDRADRGNFDRERKPRTSSFTDTRSFDDERKPRSSSLTDTRATEKEWKPRATSFAEKRIFDREREPRTELSDASDKPPSFGSRLDSPRSAASDSSSEPRHREERETRREQGSSRADDGPIRIHHTTAASQFLYGRSVVEAALKDSRRQLYKLYIYSGEDRRNIPQDLALEQLARRKGVDITMVPNSGLRMMDKMSGGRPHNGCVLEASPLPQLPVKALGPLSEDPAKPGFHVDLAHQSSEEAKINGTSNFVGYQLPKGRNPFVLLLDGILDPGNLGAILRTAAFLGVNGIAITKDSSATLTAVALKASAGASEVATLFSVHSTVDFITRSKENGWSVYAAVPSTKRSRANSHLTVDRVETYDPLATEPTVLVIGSEGEGLSKPVRRLADHEVSIPSPSGGFLSVVDSLNVSVATGILCAAFLKKQSSGMIEIEDTPLESGGETKEGLW